MSTGFCKLTATTQRWMDTTDAVQSWRTLGRDYALFEYDADAEIPAPPSGVMFAEEDWDDIIADAAREHINQLINDAPGISRN